jgi:hypothetical protein
LGRGICREPVSAHWAQVNSRTFEDPLDVFVTIKYKLDNVCDPADFGPEEPSKTLDDLVRNLIEEEGGVLGLVEDKGEVVSIREAR